MDKTKLYFVMRWIVGPIVYKIFKVLTDKGDPVGYAAFADNTLKTPVETAEKLGVLQNKLTERSK